MRQRWKITGFVCLFSTMTIENIQAQSPASLIPLTTSTTLFQDKTAKLPWQQMTCSLEATKPKDTAPSISTLFTLECPLYATNETYYGKPDGFPIAYYYGAIPANGTSTYGTILDAEPIVHDILRRYPNGQQLLYTTDHLEEKPSTLILLDDQSRPIWKYLVPTAPKKSISFISFDATALTNGYVAVYYNPTLSTDWLPNNEVGYNQTSISLVIDRLNQQGTVINSQKTDVKINAETRITLAVEEGKNIGVWPLQDGGFAISLLSLATNSKTKTQASYQVVFFKEDGQVSSQAEINLEKNAAQGTKKFFVDPAGNILVLAYSGQGKESWQSVFQNELTLYNRQGQQQWQRPILPAKNDTGKSACLSWDLLINPPATYVVICEQRRYVKGEWVKNEAYHQLLAVQIDGQGRERKRQSILSATDMSFLYYTNQFGINASVWQSVLVDDQLFFSLQQDEKPIQRSDFFKQITEGQITLSEMFNLRLYQVKLVK